MPYLRELDTLDRREFYVYLLIFGLSSCSLIVAAGIVHKNFFTFSEFLTQQLLSSPKYAVGLAGLMFMVIVFRYLALVKDKWCTKATSWTFLRVTLAIELLVGISYFKVIDSDSFKDVFFASQTTTLPWNYLQTELHCCANTTTAERESLCSINESDCMESLTEFYNGQNQILGNVVVLSLVVQVVVTMFLRTCIRCNCPSTTKPDSHYRKCPSHRLEDPSLSASGNISIGDARIV